MEKQKAAAAKPVAEIKNGQTTTANPTTPVLEVVKTSTVPAVVEVSAGERARRKIEKLAEFQALVEKHERLEGRKKGLERFLVGSDSQREKLTITNGSEAFELSNSEAIKECVQVLKKRNEEQLAVAENEVNAFIF